MTCNWKPRFRGDFVLVCGTCTGNHYTKDAAIGFRLVQGQYFSLSELECILEVMEKHSIDNVLVEKIMIVVEHVKNQVKGYPEGPIMPVDNHENQEG